MLLLCVLPQLGIETQAASCIEDAGQIDASAYTTVYAEKLNKIFDGKVALFSNSKVKYALGDSMNIRTNFRIADTITGSQCYIYSQAVYYYLFGDVVYHGEGYKYWSDSKLVLSNKKTVSYDMFSKAKVGFGAYIRTTPNSNGSYNGGNGHSMILLAYDKETVTVLEGNADGRGLIRITQQTWSEFNSDVLTSKGRRICHIIQCKSAACEHTAYSAQGSCKKCGEAFDFSATFDSGAAGLYAVTAAGGVSVRSKAPYDSAKEAFFAEEGARMDVLGSVSNAQKELWYEVSYKGKTGYVNAQSLTEDTQTPGMPVLQCAAKAVDNKPTAFTWKATANTTHFELQIDTKNDEGQWELFQQEEDVSSGVSYELTVGEYRAQLLAYNENVAHPEESGCLYTAAEPVNLTVSHSHTYATKVITEATCTSAGAKQLVCQTCGESDTKKIPVKSHTYVDHKCVDCGAAEPCVVQLTVSAKADTGKPGLSWNKVSGAKKYEVYRATSQNGKYTKLTTTKKTSYADTKAAAGKQYFYKVKVTSSKSAYNGKYSWPVDCWADCAKPSVTVKTDASTGKPSLSWKTVTGAKSYRIFRRLPGEDKFVKIAESTEKSFLDKTALVNTKYEYRVQAAAAKSGADSAVSATVKVTAVCARPVVKTAVADSGKPVITWKAVEGAKEYKIYRSTKATDSIKSYTCKGSVTELSYEDTSAAGGKTYYYKVIAIGEKGNSAYSAYKKEQSQCSAPQLKVSGNSADKPVLKWGKVTGAKKYEIRYSTDGKTFKKLTTTKKTGYTHTGAKAGVSYVYKVRALGSSDGYHSRYSPEKQFDVACAAPSVKIKADAATGQPVLTWKKVTGAVKYEIYRSVSGGKYALLDTCKGVSYQDGDTKAGAKYSYRVVALGKEEAFRSDNSKAVSLKVKK